MEITTRTKKYKDKATVKEVIVVAVQTKIVVTVIADTDKARNFRNWNCFVCHKFIFDEDLHFSTNYMGKLLCPDCTNQGTKTDYLFKKAKEITEEEKQKERRK